MYRLSYLTLLIPNHFGLHFIPREGVSGHPPPPTISSTLSRTNVKFCKVLEKPFKVSENKRSVKDLFYGYHGNCLITWCFSLTIVQMIMKNRYFQMLPETTNFKVLNKTSCNDSSILLFQKSNFKVGASARWKNRAKCRKTVIFPGLKQGIFQVVPYTSEHSILHLSDQIHTPQISNLHFLTNFKQFPHFLTLSLFWG